MAAVIQTGAKVQKVDIHKRKSRTTSDDEEWERVTGYKRNKKSWEEEADWEEAEEADYEPEEEEEEAEEEEEEEEEEDKEYKKDKGKEKEEDEVEQICDMRIGTQGQVEVWVKWKGWDEEHNTWEDLTMMGNALDCVEEFIKAQFL